MVVKSNVNLPSYLLLGLASLLLVVSILSYLYNTNSLESIISSFRILIETILVICVFKYFKKYLDLLFLLIVYISLFNSVVVIIQVFESLGYLSSNLNAIIEFWGVRNEAMRKSGIFNSILTSSFITFLAIIISIYYRVKYLTFIVFIFLISLFFGARTFLLPALLIFPFMILKNFGLKYFISFFSIILPLMILIILSFYQDLLVSLVDHLYERVVPAFKVLFGANLNNDYSTRDLISHYRFPDSQELLIGNGMPRYSELGGRDPTYTRWLLQSGFLSLITIFLINITILYLAISTGNIFITIYGVVIFLSTFKGELTTATALYSLSLIFLMSAKMQKGVRIATN